MGTPPDVPLVGEGCDRDLSTWMIVVMDALTYSKKVLLMMVLGLMGTSGDIRVGLCARVREIVQDEQDGYQIRIHEYNWIQQARASMKGLPVGSLVGIPMNSEAPGGMAVTL